jgi:hypothetical protein
MTVLAGLVTAALILGLASAMRQGRSIPFYGTVLIVIALAYVLFAAMHGGTRLVALEGGVAAGFIGLAVAGTRWLEPQTAGFLLAGGLIAHGGFDLVHDALLPNPVVPAWWPVYCAVVDIALGGWVAVLARSTPDAVRTPADRPSDPVRT